MLWSPQVQTTEAAQGIPVIAVAELPTEAGAPAPKGSAPPCRARYREYTVKTPGTRNRGARRIISGKPNEYYYTADHYKTFKRILE